MMFKNIDLMINHGCAVITLKRPDRLNSLNAEAMVDLACAVDEAEANPQVRVLMLTGEGRAFCAGQDLSDPAMRPSNSRPVDIGAVVERHYKPLVLRLQNLRIPTIAAVNGLAAGGGASIALACDLVVAAKSAYFLQAFSKIGLTPDTGSTWFLTHKLGTARAIGLMYLAEKLSAEQALSWGLIWQVYEDEEFAARASELAAWVSTLPTKALVRTRELVHTALGHTLEQQLSMEATIIREMGRGKDYEEGVLAFAEKRKPSFTGG